MEHFEYRLKEMEENAFCFLNLLPDYVDNIITAPEVLIPLERHVRSCPRCAQELETLRRAMHADRDGNGQEDRLEHLPGGAAFLEAFSQAPPPPQLPPKVLPGQVWATPGFPPYLSYSYGITDRNLPYSLEPRPLYIADFDPETRIASGFPLNCEYLEFTAHPDLKVQENESPLGFPFAVETWNPTSTHEDFLLIYYGNLPANLTEKINALTQTANNPNHPDPPTPVRRFRKLEKQVTRCISAPALEKEELQKQVKQIVSKGILETMAVYAAVHIRRHKDFLPLAGTNTEDPENKGANVQLFSTKHPLFNEQFNLEITVNEKEHEYLLQLRVTNTANGEETRGFTADILPWNAPLPTTSNQIKTAYLLHRHNNPHLHHLHLWESPPHLTLPKTPNLLLTLYRPDNPDNIECIPIVLSQ